MTENDYRLINLRYSCPLLRQEDLQAGKVPTAPTISSMIGGLQAQEALKLIHGMPPPSGSALVFNGVANSFYETKFVAARRLPQPRDLSRTGRTAAHQREHGSRAVRGGARALRRR